MSVGQYGFGGQVGSGEGRGGGHGRMVCRQTVKVARLPACVTSAESVRLQQLQQEVVVALQGWNNIVSRHLPLERAFERLVVLHVILEDGVTFNVLLANAAVIANPGIRKPFFQDCQGGKENSLCDVAEAFTAEIPKRRCLLLRSLLSRVHIFHSPPLRWGCRDLRRASDLEWWVYMT